MKLFTVLPTVAVALAPSGAKVFVNGAEADPKLNAAAEETVVFVKLLPLPPLLFTRFKTCEFGALKFITRSPSYVWFTLKFTRTLFIIAPAGMPVILKEEDIFPSIVINPKNIVVASGIFPPGPEAVFVTVVGAPEDVIPIMLSWHRVADEGVTLNDAGNALIAMLTVPVIEVAEQFASLNDVIE